MIIFLETIGSLEFSLLIDTMWYKTKHLDNDATKTSSSILDLRKLYNLFEPQFGIYKTEVLITTAEDCQSNKMRWD